MLLDSTTPPEAPVDTNGSACERWSATAMMTRVGMTAWEGRVSKSPGTRSDRGRRVRGTGAESYKKSGQRRIRVNTEKCENEVRN